MLALELLLFEWKPRSLVPVAIASITAGIARYFLLGALPIFPVIHHPVLSPSTLWLAAVIGLAVGFRQVPSPLRPAVHCGFSK
jgi:chloride channel protein, CIC family